MFEIARMMARGEYEKGRTAPVLATAWGLSVSAVEKAASEAKRLHRFVSDRDEARLQLAHMLLEASDEVRRMLKDKNLLVRLEGLKHVVPISDRQSKLTGADEPTRGTVALTGANGTPLGLPPVLAVLHPPATPDEVRHFAGVDPDACQVEGCRVHGVRMLEGGHG